MANDPYNEFNPDIVSKQIIEARKKQLLTEQRQPQGVIHQPQHVRNNPKFDPRLDTKMTFNSSGQAIAVNGKPVEEVQRIDPVTAAKLGLENTPEAIAAARNYHQDVLKRYRQGVPAHLQMHGINEWAPVREVSKYASMVDLGDSTREAVTAQAQQIREYSERKFGRPEDTDQLMSRLNGQQQVVASQMISNLAQGKARFLHEVNKGSNKPLLREAGPAPQPAPANLPQNMVKEGAFILKVLDTGGMAVPCMLSRPIAQYNPAQHGLLTLTGRSSKTFIIQNEQARIDMNVINNNPQYIKEVVEVVDSRGGQFFVLRESLNMPMSQGQGNSRFLTDQKRLAPTPPVQQNGIGANQNFQQFMQKRFIKG